MSTEGDTASDPDTGRWVVWVVGGLGVAGVVALGTLQSCERADVTASAETRARPGEARSRAFDPALEVDTLMARAKKARTTLDVAALTELSNALRSASGNTPEEDRQAVELELADVLSTRALEASIRARTIEAQRADAERVVASTIEAAQPVLDALEAAGADPGRVRAARARLELAAGDDVLASHPVVLMPTFRDEELRLAAMAGPLWRESEGPGDTLGDIVETLRGSEHDSGLVQGLLAVALQTQGEDEAALSIVDAMLEEVPSQPMARGLRAELTGGARADGAIGAEAASTEPVAVALDAASDPNATPRSTGVSAPEPTAPPEVAPAPEPTPAPESKPERRRKPTPKPKPSGTRSRRPKKMGYDELVSDGCKKVRSGDADGGFGLLTRAFDLNPGAVKVTICMAEAHHKLGRAASARAMAERALGKSPKNKRALLLMAKLEAARGDTASALQYYRRVLAIDPDNPTATKYVERHG